MKYITTRLKRYKIIIIISNILLIPLRLPFYLLFKIGEGSEVILNYIDSIVYKVLNSVIKLFKFEEVARKQYEVNSDKFKMKKRHI